MTAMTDPGLKLTPGALTLEALQAIHAGGVALAIDPAAAAAIRASAAVVQRAAAGDAPVYGVNTGFGKLANQRISATELGRLQLNLIRSHSVGVGAPLGAAGRAPDARAEGGVAGARRLGRARGRDRHAARGAQRRPRAVRAVAGLGRRVGRPGAARAHDAGADRRRRDVDAEGRRVPAAAALAEAGIAPLALAAKEGLALINGTQVSTALALHALLSFEPVLEAALVVGALTVDAARGSDGPFDPRIHALRGQPGQIDVARYYRALLAGSEIRRSHLEGDDRVQDPYSLRCQPQVVGACLDQLRHAALVLVREANAVTDNPLVFAATAAPRAASSRAATSTPSRSRSRPTRWRWRSPRSARSPSGASRC